MKKKIIYAMAIAAILGLTACGGGGNSTPASSNPTSSQQSTPASVTPSVAPSDPSSTPSSIPSSSEAVVHFDSGYADVDIADKTFAQGETFSDPVVEGCTILAWFTDEDHQNLFDGNIVNGMTLYGAILKGEGTESSPWRIYNARSLTYLTHNAKTITGVANLEADVTYNSHYDEIYANSIFNGVFNGNGHEIYIDADAIGNDTGIFYKIGEEGNVKDVRIKGALIATHASLGALANYNAGAIDNVSSKGTQLHQSDEISNGYSDGVHALTTYLEDGTTVDKDLGTCNSVATYKKGGAGGIVGTNEATGLISHCVNQMNVKATVGGGGIAGNNRGRIVDCYNKGIVGQPGDACCNFAHSVDYSYMGGITGINFGDIEHCGNYNKVFTQRLPWLYQADDDPASLSTKTNGRNRIGGIAGANTGNIDECVNYGRVHGDWFVGGITGQNTGNVTDSLSSSYLGGRRYVGSIVGFMPEWDDSSTENPVVDSCYGIARIKSSGKTVVTDETGEWGGWNAEPVELADGKTTAPTDTIADFYTLARYAKNSVYHNNQGNIAPEDKWNAETTNKTAKAKPANDNGYVALSAGREGEANPWLYKEDAKFLSPFSSAWQNYYIYTLGYQYSTLTAVVDGASTDFEAMKGINYLTDAAGEIKTSSTYGDYYNGKVKAGYNYYCCYLPGEFLDSYTIEVPEGKKLIWTTSKDDAATEWDGFLTGDITVYPLLVDAPVEETPAAE